MDDEGVVKFTLRHEPAPAEPSPAAAPLLAWRDILHALGLVGQDPRRYGGAGYGNLSARGRGASFLITGTQTGQLPRLGPKHLALVRRVDIDANAVESRGPARPSSEAMTHGAVYALDRKVRAIAHAHSPDIWTRARALGIPITRASVAYGTPAMAREVARVWPRAKPAGALAMGGHEDGIITFGASMDEAGARMVTLLARARANPARTRRAP